MTHATTNHRISMSGNTFRGLLAETTTFNDDTIRGVALHATGGHIVAVATDGDTLIRNRTEAPDAIFPLIVLATTDVAAMVKESKGAGMVYLQVEGGHLTASYHTGGELVAQLIVPVQSKKYMDYQRVIPGTDREELELLIGAQSFNQVIRDAKKAAREEGRRWNSESILVNTTPTGCELRFFVRNYAPTPGLTVTDTRTTDAVWASTAPTHLLLKTEAIRKMMQGVTGAVTVRRGKQVAAGEPTGPYVFEGTARGVSRLFVTMPTFEHDAGELLPSDTQVEQEQEPNTGKQERVVERMVETRQVIEDAWQGMMQADDRMRSMEAMLGNIGDELLFAKAATAEGGCGIEQHEIASICKRHDHVTREIRSAMRDYRKATELVEAGKGWLRVHIEELRELTGTIPHLGTPGQVLAVNASGDGLEFTDPPGTTKRRTKEEIETTVYVGVSDWAEQGNYVSIPVDRLGGYPTSAKPV